MQASSPPVRATGPFRFRFVASASHMLWVCADHPSSMEGSGRHNNRLAGTTLRERHADLTRQMEAELKKRGVAFHDPQSVVVPTQGYWGGGGGGEGDLGLFYCQSYDANACAACLGCCPCDGGGASPADGGAYYPNGPKAAAAAQSSACAYTAPINDCFIGLCDLGEAGCQRFGDLATAKGVCSLNPKCLGVIQSKADGAVGYETRSGPAMERSPSGERCYRKLRSERCELAATCRSGRETPTDFCV